MDSGYAFVRKEDGSASFGLAIRMSCDSDALLSRYGERAWMFDEGATLVSYTFTVLHTDLHIEQPTRLQLLEGSVRLSIVPEELLHAWNPATVRTVCAESAQRHPRLEH